MALSQPTAGDTFLLAFDIGEGSGALEAGSIVEVFDVVEPGTPGTGNAVGEPVVIFAVWEVSTVLDESGTPVEGIALRHLSRPLSEFDALVVPDVHAAA